MYCFIKLHRSVLCRLLSGIKQPRVQLKTVMEKPRSLRFLKYPCQSNAVSSECVFYLSRVIESEDETHSLPPSPSSSISPISIPPSSPAP